MVPEWCWSTDEHALFWMYVRVFQCARGQGGFVGSATITVCSTEHHALLSAGVCIVWEEGDWDVCSLCLFTFQPVCTGMCAL